jgi:SPP1 family predicted phage head-tail adaptor
MNLVIGKLDRQIVIQRNTPTRDSEGGLVDSWANLRTIWASKEDRGGGKSFRAGAYRPETDTVFTIYYTENLTEQDRIVYRSKNYSILSIGEIGRKEGLIVQTTTEVVQP